MFNWSTQSVLSVITRSLQETPFFTKTNKDHKQGICIYLISKTEKEKSCELFQSEVAWFHIRANYNFIIYYQVSCTDRVAMVYPIDGFFDHWICVNSGAEHNKNDQRKLGVNCAQEANDCCKVCGNQSPIWPPATGVFILSPQEENHTSFISSECN